MMSSRRTAKAQQEWAEGVLCADLDPPCVTPECSPDCNGNGVPDECDIADGTSDDLNGNGIPDECEA